MRTPFIFAALLFASSLVLGSTPPPALEAGERWPDDFISQQVSEAGESLKKFY